MSDYSVYEGISIDSLKHIPEVSCYNSNYYIGLKRKECVCNDLIYAHSDDDNITNYFIDNNLIGESFCDEDDIIHVIV